MLRYNIYVLRYNAIFLPVVIYNVVVQSSYVEVQHYLPVVIRHVAVKQLCVEVQRYLSAVIHCYVAVQRSCIEVHGVRC